jgi:hypothetical protein
MKTQVDFSRWAALRAAQGAEMSHNTIVLAASPPTLAQRTRKDGAASVEMVHTNIVQAGSPVPFAPIELGAFRNLDSGGGVA